LSEFNFPSKPLFLATTQYVSAALNELNLYEDCQGDVQYMDKLKDNKTVYTMPRQGHEVFFWDMETGKLLNRIKSTENTFIRHFLFSPDESVAYMVELVEEQQAVGWKVWDMKTLKSTDGNELPGEVAKEIPFEICLSNDGQYLAMVVYTLDRCAIWKIADWTKIKEFTAEFDYNRPSPISETVRFNPVQLIYPAGNDSFVIKTKEHAIWWEGGFISGQEKKVAIQHRPIACSPSGRYIAIRHPETINLYDLHDKGHILLSCPDTTINPHASFDSLERYFGFRVRQKAQAMVLTTKEIHSYPIEKFAREVFFPAGTNYFVALKSTFSLAIWDVESEVMQADFHVHQLIRKV